MGKTRFKFRQWWRDWLSFLQVRRFEGVITNASEDDIANSSFKSPEEALDFLKEEFQERDEEVSSGCISLTKSNLSKTKIGMFWYEDDTCSFVRINGKKIKAVIELIEGNIIYGNLMVSECYDIQKIKLLWRDDRDNIGHFFCSCNGNEKIVAYSINQLVKVYESIEIIRKTFSLIGKKYREAYYWTTADMDMWQHSDNNDDVYDGLHKDITEEFDSPVLALDLN